MENRVTAFKLLCDADGKIFAVEAGDGVEGYRAGEVIGSVDSLEVTFPSQKISEFKLTSDSMAKVCCRIILGRLVCGPC